MKKLLLFLFATLCYSTISFAQWTSDPRTNTLVTEEGVWAWYNEVVTSKNGVTYSLAVQPGGTDDNGYYIMVYNLQILDKDGYRVLPEEGLIISQERNKSWTVANRYIATDDEDNAVIIVQDCRNASMGSDYLGFTAYKFDKEGNKLWETDLAGGDVYYGCAMCQAVQTTDTGYLTTFFSYDASGMSYRLHLEKLDYNGKSEWTNEVGGSYPFLVEAGDNKVILIYPWGGVAANMIDATDGSFVWDSDVLLTNGSPSGQIQNNLKVISDSEGGAFVSWYEGTSTYVNYVGHIKNDGTLGLTGTMGGVQVSYDDTYARMSPALYYDAENKSLYAVYREYLYASQDYVGIFMQKISSEGELLWGAEGKPVVDIQNSQTAINPSVQGAGGSDFVVFWQQSLAYTNTNSYARKYDADGNALWSSDVSLTTRRSYKKNLSSSNLIGNNYWVLSYGDNYGYSITDYVSIYALCLDINGELGDNTVVDTGIGGVMMSGSSDGLKIYNISGQLIKEVSDSQANSWSLGLAPGLYIVKDSSGEAQKIIVK